jgi:CheY-like chemotaxis protein
MARVLVVDDDPDILALVQRQLQTRGHQTLGAASPHEALALLAGRGAPDVAVLDVTMPRMTGLELATELRALDGMERLPVVFLSARVQPQDVAAGQALDATYLTKPFRGSALAAALDRVLGVTGAT